ncbi:FabD/lysophospholipase-like protein [Lojkania enalia]|uniref:FabD/lysophospholipase-like protein n=1 Tax=Lojkania enalia TaxID=147567 RepID=A0A9P4K8U5_9PLEO|nr:FabD/lysophospholipase-like protein [Didymosphaeria enalia]
MSWVEVNFNLVRYSPVEQTHYFYDPNYPTAIQFLLSGRWEPWDVGWVRNNAKDPEVKRIAEDAETKLINDLSSGYRPWPPSGVDGVAGPSASHGHSASTGNTRLLAARVVPHDDTPGEPQSQNHALAHNHGSPNSVLPPHSRPYISPYQPSPITPTFSHESFSHYDNSQGRLTPGTSNGSPPAHFPQDVNGNEAPPSPIPTVYRETKVLLSLDGGGVRGLSQVLLVESLVNAICTRMGRRADPFQIFDLIGGSSTGGLLAIMLGRLRMRPHRAREAYVKLAKTKYYDQRNFCLSMDPHAVLYQNEEDDHENAIKDVVRGELGGSEDELFVDPRPDSTHVFVVSTKVDIGFNRPALIRSYPTRRISGPEIDPDMKVWEAMKATSAAPRYAAGGAVRRSVIAPGLVDYGTAKNNPVKDLVYECRKLYSFANDTQIIISIGAGMGADRSQELQEMANGVDIRNMEANAAADKFQDDFRPVIESGWMKYFRFNVPNLHDVPLEEWDQMDKMMEKTRAYLEDAEVGHQFYACVDAVAALLMGEPWKRN